MVAGRVPSGATVGVQSCEVRDATANQGIIVRRSSDTLVANARRIRWNNVATLTLAHALACLALLPWFFSWTGVALALIGIYGFGSLGINIGYHRLLAHRGFVCTRWLEYTLAVLGTCCAQDSPPMWVAIHRKHHQHSDSDADPHSPVGHVFWGYLGWLLVKQEPLDAKRLLDRYARDLMRDPFYAWLERSDNWLKVVVASWLVFFVLGTAAALALGSDIHAASQFGLSVMIWGAVVRTVLVLQITFIGNAMHHMWGYRNYDTNDNSRNNLLVTLMTNGEGWHNNHHADPRSAKHSHKPGEFDLSWQTIRLLEMLGLVRDVVLPSTPLARAYRAAEESAN